MDQNCKAVVEKRIQRTMESLQKNNMQAYYAATKEDTVAQVAGLLKPDDVISFGGSMSLRECGVMELLRSGSYPKLMDRDQKGLTREQVQEIYRKSFFADVYLMSSNAVTESGVLYNVDGNGNRVAALTFGPKSVIVVMGYNKIVKDLDEAVRRVKTVSAPANAVRLNCETYCRHTGVCVSLSKEHPEMADGCRNSDRVCATYVVSGQQRVKDRIKVILVGEELGY